VVGKVEELLAAAPSIRCRSGREKPFLMPWRTCFSIYGARTVATGGSSGEGEGGGGMEMLGLGRKEGGGDGRLRQMSASCWMRARGQRGD